jgi:hypothetical protein
MRVSRRSSSTHLDSIHLTRHRYVLDNTTDFEGKMQRLVNHVSKLVGLPTNLSKRSAKYLLRKEPDLSLFHDVDYHVFQVEKVTFPLTFQALRSLVLRRYTAHVTHVRGLSDCLGLLENTR